MKWVIAAVVVVVAVLHHDFWQWRDKTLVFGFLPSGLAYHAGFSILASLTMWMLVHFLWPKELDEAEPVPAPVSVTAEGRDA